MVTIAWFSMLSLFLNGTRGSTQTTDKIGSHKGRYLEAEERSLLVPELVVSYPGLGGSLDCVPGCAEGRGVGQVELAHGVDGHVVVYGGGKDVYPFGDLGPKPADELGAEQYARGGVPGDPSRYGVRGRVVGLVVVGRALGRGGRVAGGECLVVAQAGGGRPPARRP